jgi:CYTH domain-containing protein
MGKNYEIERKFLVEFPDVEKLDVRKRIGIKQTYLSDGESHSQRRVRRLDENGRVYYTYTEKVFLTPVTREENECTIELEDYKRLLKEAKKEFKPVEKVRYAFNYHDQLFELDTYPFSDKLAIMELELKSAEQEIDFPDNVRVIKDVSADKRYSNSALASAGRFPTDKIGENY